MSGQAISNNKGRHNGVSNSRANAKKLVSALNFRELNDRRYWALPAAPTTA